MNEFPHRDTVWQASRIPEPSGQEQDKRDRDIAHGPGSANSELFGDEDGGLDPLYGDEDGGLEPGYDHNDSR